MCVVLIKLIKLIPSADILPIIYAAVHAALMCQKLFSQYLPYILPLPADMSSLSADMMSSLADMLPFLGNSALSSYMLPLLADVMSLADSLLTR